MIIKLVIQVKSSSIEAGLKTSGTSAIELFCSNNERLLLIIITKNLHRISSTVFYIPL